VLHVSFNDPEHEFPVVLPMLGCTGSYGDQEAGTFALALLARPGSQLLMTGCAWTQMQTPVRKMCISTATCPGVSSTPARMQTGQDCPLPLQQRTSTPHSHPHLLSQHHLPNPLG
jgi:hypothetical protein